VGIGTLRLASIAAVIETDGKKIVALSTLRQLGLMFLALTLGGYFICLFHLVMHAFAKANLFLVVGNLIHSRFSLQDARFIGTSRQNIIILIMALVRIFSLRGVIFTSGFFSKDYILIGEQNLFNRLTRFLVLFIIVSMTLVYCFKFLLTILQNRYTLTQALTRASAFVPRVVLRGLSVISGFIFIKNINLLNITKIRGLY